MNSPDPTQVLFSLNLGYFSLYSDEFASRKNGIDDALSELEICNHYAFKLVRFPSTIFPKVLKTTRESTVKARCDSSNNYLSN